MTAATHDAHADEKSPMAMPLPNGKLAMWLFLVTEIMFFTALIGTYLIIRNSIPNDPSGVVKWPSPEDVHLVEWIGAFNTFVLIASSLTVVLAHYAAGKGNFKNALLYLTITTVLGVVFLVVKGFEYESKIRHDILPGHMGELKEGSGLAREKQFHNVGTQYVVRVKEQLQHIVHDVPEADLLEKVEPVVKAAGESGSDKVKKQATEIAKVKMELAKLDKSKADQQKQAAELSSDLLVATAQLLDKIEHDIADKHAEKDLSLQYKNNIKAILTLKAAAILTRTRGREPNLNDPKYRPPLTPAQVGTAVNHLLHEGHHYNNEVHLSPAIPYGNMWSSCYFAMTGFHALHVLGGIVMFGIYLIIGVTKGLGPQHVPGLEYTGLYWHFVDIVWIFLFPLLYLV